MENERKINTIDVSKMTEKEICELLGIKYTPWYKSVFFWSLTFCFAMPNFLFALSLLIN